jgi:hypothetical protein
MGNARLSGSALGILALLLASVGPWPGSTACALTLDGFPASDFSILGRDGGNTIGRSHFEVTHDGDSDVLHGESHYFDGQYDIEVDRFAPAGDGSTPTLVHYDHRFFDARGAPLLVTTADFRNGAVVCTEYRGATPLTRAASLDIPPGTWAGSSVLIAIQDALRRSAAVHLKLSYLNCAPGPRLLTVEVTLVRGARASRFIPEEALEVGVRVDFGWLNFVIARFMPETRAWFDASRSFKFVGAELPRYYGGPEVLMIPDEK